MKLELSKNWKKLYKSYSLIFTVLIALFTLVEMIVPSMGLIESSFTPETYGKIVFVLTILSGVGRFVKQNLESEELEKVE